MSQAELFPQPLPRGLVYQQEFLRAQEEADLLRHVRSLPLREAQYRQFTARRRTVNYGFAYDFQQLEAMPAPAIPDFLQPLRAKAATFAGVVPDEFVQALVAEYRPGTPLGWHRDVPDFELIVGISLGGSARMRFRPYPWDAARKKQVFAMELEPRSAYILRDEARWRWQHCVSPTKMLRYSITFRTARQAGTAPPASRSQ